MVTLMVCIVTSNGTLTMDGEVSTLVAGHAKISFALSGWTWAADGAFLDVEINVKIPAGRSVSKASQQGSDRK